MNDDDDDGDDDDEEEEQEGGAKPTKAEGFKLHMSKRKNSRTGYLGVYKQPNRGRFEARAPHRDGRQQHLGTFGTAVEAAVAVAKHHLARSAQSDDEARLPAAKRARTEPVEEPKPGMDGDVRSM